MAWYHILPFTGLSRRSRGHLYANIAQVLESGIPVIRGLQILEQQAPNGQQRKIFRAMKEHIDAGGDLGSAMKTMPEYFPEEEAMIIATTETTGTVPLTFQRLSDYLIWFSDIIRTALVGLIYPAFLLGFAWVGIRVFRAVFLGGLTDVLTIVIWEILNFLAIVVLAIVVWRILMKIPLFQYIVLSFFMLIPVIGSTIKQLARARFAKTYECMVAAGVPYFHGLRQSADSCGNHVIKHKIHKIIPMVEDGASLSNALMTTNMFTPLSLGILEVGEESGKMEESLRRFANEEERKAQLSIQAIGRMLPPVIMIFVAAYLAFYVIIPFYMSRMAMLNSF